MSSAVPKSLKDHGKHLQKTTLIEVMYTPLGGMYITVKVYNQEMLS